MATGRFIASGVRDTLADTQILEVGARIHHGYLASTAPEAHPLEHRLSAIPVTALWSPT